MKTKEKSYKGIAVSPGIAIGKVFIFDSSEDSVVQRPISEEDLPKEIARFEDALIATRREILNIQRQISQKLDVEHAQIFNAHLMVLEDRALIEEVIKRLEKDQYNVEYVFQQVIKKYCEIFSQINDEYLKERSSDIRDVSRRVLHNLTGKKREDLVHLPEEMIVAAYDLSPSDTALMHKERVIGFVTDIGSKTSHTAIMARSLEIPAVVGLHDLSSRLKMGETIILDGNRGVVIVNPSKSTLASYKQERQKVVVFENKLAVLKDLTAKTLDGHEITLSANIEMPEDIHSVLEHGAHGVGLYRTEFFYMNRSDLPTEEEHFKAYQEVAKKVWPHDVIVRTLDLGGDKFLSHLEIPREMNPFLGWRAIRFCLERLDIFKVQLRAILRASTSRNIKLMYPMISGLDELIRANEVLKDVKGELKKEGVPFNDQVEVGAMIEIPSAALTADVLAKHVDFFSIGTNDLIQYSLAVDRVNEKIAHLYQPAHPAVLRLIQMVIEAAHEADIWVGMCGEMAGDPAMALILLGLGLDELSTSPSAVPEIKKIIRSVHFSVVQQLAREVLSLTSAQEIERKAVKLLTEIAPELIMLHQERAKRRKALKRKKTG
ncbi:MAG: phosphoenolpyruvate--protein phosphotransferase [Chlamydiae bacterium]|nr:phosphoenolpyruvate--protein phosphotransferase [Chlamydiota bacterium]MBI3267055.1 phosphoenolpyruvate--protein phosphotransferase [Chlamydiota bacterium]